jgi:ABC-type dipeptide/oligopeptide/nickel transport system ATPase component
VPPLLRVEDLKTHYIGFRGTRVVKAVDGVSFTLEEGETFGLVGESGCGKTTTCHSIVRLLPPTARIVGGRVELEGEDLVGKSQGEMRQIRGGVIATILQDPMASLDPLFSIYDQVAEPAYYHQSLRGQRLRHRVRQLLTSVRIPSPEMRMKEFPHQMSGGMRQRIVGAIAQAGGPKIIIADEPTTNLDVTIQLQYLNLLKDLQRASGVALIFVTHNLGIVAKMCDRVAVMYAGRIVELQSVRGLFYHPRGFPAVTSRRRAAGDRPKRRGTQRAQPTVGLPLPPALSLRHAALFRTRARAGRGIPRTPCGLLSLLTVDFGRPLGERTFRHPRMALS